MQLRKDGAAFSGKSRQKPSDGADGGFGGRGCLGMAPSGKGPPYKRPLRIKDGNKKGTATILRNPFSTNNPVMFDTLTTSVPHSKDKKTFYLITYLPKLFPRTKYSNPYRIASR